MPQFNYNTGMKQRNDEACGSPAVFQIDQHSHNLAPRNHLPRLCRSGCGINLIHFVLDLWNLEFEKHEEARRSTVSSDGN